MIHVAIAPGRNTQGPGRLKGRLARLATLGVASVLVIACQPAPAVPPTPTTAPKPAAPPASPSPAVAVSPSPSPSPAVLASPSPSPAAARVVTIDGTDFAFAAPDTIPGGLVTIRLRNMGREPHHAQLFRLNTNVTIEQFMATIPQGPFAILQLVSLEGGPAAIDPNGSADVTVNLPEGQYVVVCFVESPDGVPHIAKGMIRPFRVTAPPPGPPPPAPAAAGTVRMKDFSFDLPTTIAARTTLRVVNDGPQPHEMSIVRLPAGKTPADIQQFFAGPPTTPPPGPPPFAASVGGINGLGRDGSGFAILDLQPGEYAAVCLIPDPSSGKPHAGLGMVAGFTIR